MRQNPIPFIPAQALQVAPNQTPSRIARLIGSAGQLAQAGIAIQTGSVEESNAKAAAMAKLNLMAEQQSQELGQVELNERIRESQRQEQSAEQNTRVLERSIRKIEDNEKLGIFAAVNGLTPEQLATANANGLGFRAPEAVIAVDRAIGERQANLDFPRLLQAIAGDESRLPSQHLQNFLTGREWGSDGSGMAYRATLAERLERYEQSAILSRAEKAKSTIIQNAVDGFQFNVVTGFQTLDRAGFQNDLAALYRGLKHAQPDLTEAEFKQAAVQALEPLFVGPEARFPAIQGYGKLSELFSEEDIERFGLGGAMSQLKAKANQEFASTLGDNIANASSFAQIQTNLQAVDLLLGRQAISPTQAQEIKTNAQKQIQKVRANEEVEAVINRNGSVLPLTKDHDDAIDLATDRRGLVGAQATAFQVQTFGRLTQRSLQQMDALATSVDGRELPEAVAMWQSIQRVNPAYAFELTAGESSPLPEKLSAIALDVQARGPGAIASGAGVPERFYDASASIFDEPPEGEKPEAARLTSTGFLFWGQPGQTVSNAEQQRAFRAISVAYMARAQEQGETDAVKLYKESTRYAEQQIKKLYQPMRLAGEVYAVRSDVAGIMRQTERTFDNVQLLAKERMREVSGLLPGGDFRFDFGSAQVREDKLIVPLLVNGERSSESLWLRVGLSPFDIQEQVDEVREQEAKRIKEIESSGLGNTLRGIR